MLFKKGERTTGELCCEIIRPVSKGPMAELYLAVLIGTEHKLMVKALLCENEIDYNDDNNNIVAKFNENSVLTIEFDNNGLLKKVSGNLSL